jgi:hypothetical protein
VKRILEGEVCARVDYEFGREVTDLAREIQGEAEVGFHDAWTAGDDSQSAVLKSW